MVKWQLREEVISATRETVRFRFKTTVADGVILYSRGTQGDFLALQLKDNRMLLNIDLGQFTILQEYACSLHATASQSVGDCHLYHGQAFPLTLQFLYYTPLLPKFLKVAHMCSH